MSVHATPKSLFSANGPISDTGSLKSQGQLGVQCQTCNEGLERSDSRDVIMSNDAVQVACLRNNADIDCLKELTFVLSSTFQCSF